MKILLLATLFIASGFISKAQTYPSSCTPTGLMEITYHNDACRLAIKRLHETNSPFADSVVIPQLLIDSISKALYAVHNVQNVSVIDTIKQFFGHTNFVPGSDSTHIAASSIDFNIGDGYNIKDLSMSVDNNIPWNAQWAAGNFNATTNDTINYLVTRFQLQVLKYQDIGNRTYYMVTSPVAINGEALAKLFKVISGVGNNFAHSGPSLFGSTGKTARVIFTNEGYTISYTYACIDCPMACLYGRTWNFKVNTETDCSVEYLSVETWGNYNYWGATGCPLLLYNITTEICPSGSTTFNYYNSGTNFQWQVSIDGINFTDIINNSNYSGSNTPNLNLNNTPSSWYGNTYILLINGVKSNFIYHLKFVNTWTGSTDNNWENVANWSCGSLPDANTDVILNAGNVLINANTTVRSVKVSGTATLTVATGVNFTVLH